MKKLAKVDPTSSTAEIIANNDVVETEVVTDDIEERFIDNHIHATHSLIETTKSIQDLGLLKKKIR